ncbi:hypothetical protein MOB18_05970 [Bacillus inaquosorum]|uniref:hypothetical protein n=1 Tax=Bacillus inaquosorum TaxID=483913 RepID=UPI00228095C6|nr:hypothetical protein [Bacillus inaquosorum]MCY7748660.1 hypothetical protein [Bacillus inaquosorum]
MDNFYGFRMCYTWVAYLVLCGTLNNVDSETAILNTFALFVLPLALDYYNQQPVKRINRRRVAYCMWGSIILVAFFLGLHMSDIDVSFVKQPWFKWGMACFMVLFAIASIVDWISFSSPEEMKSRAEIRKAYRESIERHKVTLAERVQFHEKEKNRPSRQRSRRSRTSRTGTAND